MSYKCEKCRSWRVCNIGKEIHRKLKGVRKNE